MKIGATRTEILQNDIDDELNDKAKMIKFTWESQSRRSYANSFHLSFIPKLLIPEELGNNDLAN